MKALLKKIVRSATIMQRQEMHKAVFKYFIFCLIIGFLFYGGTISKYSEIAFITHSYLFAIIILIIFIIFLLYLIYFGDKININLANPAIYLVIGGFLLLTFTSIVKCDSIFETYRMITPLFLFIVIINLIENINDWDLFMVGFLSFGVYMGVLNYIFFYKETGFYGGVLSSNWGYQNTFAAFIVLMSFISFGFYLNAKNRDSQMLLLVIPTFFNFLLFLTVSRGGYIAFILSSVVFILTLKKECVKTIKKSIPVIISSIMLILIGSPKDIILRNIGKEKTLTNFVAGVQNFSLWCRIHMAHLATVIFTKRPLTGFGLGSFKYTFGMFEWIGEPFRIDPHSLFFKLLAESGVIGTGIFLLFIFFYLWKALHISKDENFIYKGLFAGLTGLIFHMMIDVDIYPIMFVILFTGIALLLPQEFIKIHNIKKQKIISTTVIVTTALLIVFNLFPKTVASIYALKAEDPYMHSSIDTAVNYSRKAVKWDPKCAQFVNLLANKMIEKEEQKNINIVEISKIENLFIKAYQLNKYDRRYPFEIGIIELYKGNPDAIMYMEEARRLYPTNPHILAWLAVSYIYIDNDVDKAENLIYNAEKFDTEHSLDIVFAKGVLAASEGQPSKAKEYFSKLQFYDYIFNHLGGNSKDYVTSRYFIQIKIAQDMLKHP